MRPHGPRLSESRGRIPVPGSRLLSTLTLLGVPDGAPCLLTVRPCLASGSTRRTQVSARGQRPCDRPQRCLLPGPPRRSLPGPAPASHGRGVRRDQHARWSCAGETSPEGTGLGTELLRPLRVLARTPPSVGATASAKDASGRWTGVTV